MKCFYAAATEAHDPQFRLTHGRLMHNSEQPERARLLLKGLASLDLSVEEPPEAPRAALEAVHSARFLEFLEGGYAAWQKLAKPGAEIVPNVIAQRAWAPYPDSIVARAGWHMGDTSAPMGPGSWQATRRAADCAVAAADWALSGAGPSYALCCPPGHHTDRETAAGHCLMNVAAIAAERMRTRHDRVAILDIDVHHGNGTQAIFYERGDVLFVSVHTDPSSFYPWFWGYGHEYGAGAGEGANLNLPLPMRAGDEPWLEAIRTALAQIHRFGADRLVLSLGLDIHASDPLGGMSVTTEGIGRAGEVLGASGLPTAIIQEGGYLAEPLTDNIAAFLSAFLGAAR